MSAQTDTVIAGAGIAGLTLAVLLARAGQKVCVVERQLPAAPAEEAELRVSAISRASMEVFRRCGLERSQFGERATAFEQMHVWDASGAGEIHFDSAEMGMDTLGYIIENSRVQRALLDVLEQHDNVELRCPALITDVVRQADAMQVILEDGVIDARLIVGADGVRSLVREKSGIEFHSSAYGQSGLVCVIANELPHQNTAWQIFLADGPLAFLPMFDVGDRHQCSIVWTLPTETAMLYCELEADAFIERLSEAFQHRLGGLELVSSRSAFPLQHGHVDQYVADGVALIGDAAHVIHPLAGQGANLGILDAAALASTIITARDAGRDWSAVHNLRAYERHRKGENRLMESAMTGFNTLFSNDDQWLAMIRNAGLNIVDQAPFIKQRFMRQAMGI